VSEPADTPTILIADEDVGFVWWLGELFNESGYQAIPALNVDEALALVNKSRGRIPLLVVSPGFKEVLRLVETLSRFGPPKVVLIQESGCPNEVIAGLRAVATLERPDGWTPVSRSEWRQKVKRILSLVGIRAAS
jgi:DNA-binding NtrC family response regulator